MHESVKYIVNAYVYTGDEKNRSGVLPLLIQGDKILAIGDRAEVMSRQYTNLEVIDKKGSVIFPGFVEPCLQGESILLRFFQTNLFEQNKSTKEALRSIYRYLTTQASVEELTILYKLAYFSALKMGVTTLVEHGLDYFDTSLQASYEAMRQTELRGWIGLHNADQYEALKHCTGKSIRFFALFPPEQDLTLYNLQSTLRYAQQYQVPILITDSTSKQMHEGVKKKFGKSVLQLCKEHRVLEHPTILHNVGLYENADLQILQEKKAPIVQSLEYLVQSTRHHPLLLELFKNHVQVAVATDWGLPDQWRKMREYAKLHVQYGIQRSPYEALSTCTLKAAQALSLEQEIGSIEEGKKADLVMVKCAGLFMEPYIHQQQPDLFLGFLISESSRYDVADVMIGGEFVVREGNILIASEDLLIRDAEKLLETLYTFLPKEYEQPKQPAVVLPFQTEYKEQEDSIPFEEGFRIVRKDTKDETNRPNTSVELPKNVQRVFGEDDLDE